MKLYGASRSRSTRVGWALEEANAEYEYVPVAVMEGEARREPYIQLNPGGKVPTLVDGELILTESAAICFHIADTYPDSGLSAPLGSAERAKIYQWATFAVCELEQPLWTIAKHTFVLPEKRRVPEIKETALWEFSVALKVLSKGLGEHAFLVGNRFTLADILVGHTLMWAKSFEVPIEAENVRAYLKSLYQRSGLLKAVEREKTA